MAKLTDEIKNKISADYHTNKYSQRELAKRHNVSLGTINNITKGVVPINEHLVDAKVALDKGFEERSETEMNAIMNTANDILRRQNLVFNASEKLIKRTQDLIISNRTVEKVNVGDGIQSFQERELNTADLKNLADTVDKASITLGVNQRHASSQVTVNNTNAQQNNNTPSFEDFYTIENNVNET